MGLYNRCATPSASSAQYKGTGEIWSKAIKRPHPAENNLKTVAKQLSRKQLTTGSLYEKAHELRQALRSWAVHFSRCTTDFVCHNARHDLGVQTCSSNACGLLQNSKTTKVIMSRIPSSTQDGHPRATLPCRAPIMRRGSEGKARANVQSVWLPLAIQRDVRVGFYFRKSHRPV